MIKPMHPFAVFLLDVWLWVKSLLCLIRRHHHGSVPVFDVQRPKFRPIPMYQCRLCGTFWLRAQDAARVGGSRPKV